MMPARYLISSDLDGTLIDHHDYSFSAALPALARCQALQVPVVLNTSKTLDETLNLQRELSLHGPMIVENGSALFWCALGVGRVADDQGAIAEIGDEKIQELSQTSGQLCKKVFGQPRADILAFIADVRAAHPWRFEGFNDWSIKEISQHTGLSLDAAERANSKQFSEPFVWHDTDQALDELTELAAARGLKVLRGGRFYHLQGDTDKAKPLRWLMQHPEQVWAGQDPELAPDTVIALGDNHNDIAMLNMADIPVCVRSPVANYPELSTDNPRIKTQGYGPKGWAEAVLSILDDGAP